jgi:LysM repeat protein
MKKITESQLKDKVNSLREYLTVYENENQLLAENPYTGADAEKFARLSPADQAWYTKGGKQPDLNDPYIANRAPNKGKLGPAPQAAQQAASVTRGAGQPAADVTTDDIPFDPTWGGTKAAPDTRTGMEKFLPNWAGGKDAPVAANQNATWNNNLQAAVSNNQSGAPQAAMVTPAPADPGNTAANSAFNQGNLGTRADPAPDLANMDIGFGPGKFAPDSAPTAPAAAKANPAKVAQFKDLLAKAGVSMAPGAGQQAPAPKSTFSLAGQGAKLNANESTTYFLNKLRLIESRQFNETLTPEESKQLDKLFGELSVDFKDDPELAPLFAAYQKVPSVSSATPPAAPAAPAAGPMSNVDAAVTAASTAPAGGGPIVTTSPSQAAAVTPAAPTGPVTWKQIYELNKDIIGGNPNVIKPGQQLKMPDGSTYPVQAGDNLSKIAKKAGGGQGAKVAPTNGVTTQTGPAVDKEIANLRAANTQTVMDPKLPGFDFKKASDAANAAKQPATESVGYNELQRIVSLVNHR